MTVNKRATCPLCGRTTATYLDQSGRFYVRHYATDRGRANVHGDGTCEATGWLVEDDELVVTPRGPSPLKDIAQGPRSECRRCLGEGLFEGDLCRACGGTGTHTPQPAHFTRPPDESERA